MADLFAQNSANWDSSNMWNTAANGSGSYQTPGVTDRCMANGKTVTVNIDVSVSSISTAANGGALGGYFALNSGVTFTGDFVCGANTSVIIFSGNAPNVANVVGNGSVVAGNAGNALLVNSGTGTLNLTGNLVASFYGVYSIAANASGTMNISGSVTQGTSYYNSPTDGGVRNGSGVVSITGAVTTSTGTPAAYNGSTGTFTINGNPSSSGSGQGSYNAGAGTFTVNGNPSSSGSGQGAYNAGAGTLTVNGNPSSSGSGQGSYNAGAGTLTVNGNPSSSSSGQGSYNGSTGTLNVTPSGILTGQSTSSGACVYGVGAGVINITGDIMGGTTAPAVAGGASCGQINVSGVAWPGAGANGCPAINMLSTSYPAIVAGPAWDVSHYNAPYSGRVVIRTPHPSPLDWRVRDEDGVTTHLYTNTTLMADSPAPADVRHGVSYQSGGQTGSLRVPAREAVLYGALVDATTGLATLAASDIRAAIGMAAADLDAQLDALAGAGGGATPQQVWEYATRTITAGGLTQADVREAVGMESANLDAQLGALSSALAGSDDAVLEAIAALNNLSSSGAQAAAEAALAAYQAAKTSDVPGAATNAAAVRTELATELARVDVATSTRLEAAGYTAPANSDIAAIKAKTDNLPADPAGAGDVPTESEIAGVVLGSSVEDSLSLIQALRLILAALSGQSSGVGTTTERYKSVDGSKDRLVVTFDQDANRLTVTRDGS